MALRPVYSVQMASLSPALPSQDIVVPDGSRLIVRDMDAWEGSGAAGHILVIENAAGGVLWAIETASSAFGSLFQWRGRQVYNPGEVIRIHVFSGGWDIQVSGYELSLV